MCTAGRLRFKPFLDLDRLAYEMPTSIVGWLGAQGLGDSERIKQWDAIEEKLGHQCSSQNTLQDLSQLSPDTIITIAEEMELPGSTVARLVAAHKNLRGLTDTGMLQLAGLGEIYGDLIKGHISPCVELDQRLTEADRRKARIPADATHCVWAYQAEGFNVEQLTDEHKKVIDESCGEFAFASLGSFIYFKDVGGDGPPNVVTVNALGVGEEGKHRVGTIDREGVSSSCHTRLLGSARAVLTWRQEKCTVSTIGMHRRAVG